MGKFEPRKRRVAVVRHGEFNQPHPRRDIFALRDAGFEVDVICDSEAGKLHLEHVEGVTVIRLPIRHKRGHALRYLFEYTAVPLLAGGALAMRSVWRRYDYVEIDTMPTWLIVAAAVPKLMGSTIVLYMFEHMAELRASDTGVTERNWLVRLLDVIEMACVRAADRILTPAERNREMYIRRGIPPQKIVFIPNCPDEDVFLADMGAPNLSGARRTHPTGAPSSLPAEISDVTSTVPNPSPGFKLVTHGSLLERYGIQILLESVAILRERIPGVQLDVIGSGEYEAELKRLAHELLIDDVVRFVGPVPFQCMASRLLRADVGVGPYLLDLLPNKVMEYFLLGIPVVASDWPTLRRYFGDESVKYVRPADAQALADGIHDLYRHPRIRQRRAKIAQERYLASLTWNKTKHDYLAVYGVAEAPSAPAPGPVAARSRQNWVKFVLRQSRGPRNAMTRLPTIVNRFGITPRKSIRHFEAFLTVTDRHGVVPTLPVTAVAARRNPAVLRWLRDRGVELAAHGYVHNDYASLSAHAQREQVAIARNELDALGFTVRGWRCPYSRWNNDTMAALRAGGFEYDATPVYEWPALAQERIVMAPDARGDYARLCALFNVRDAGTRAVLPVADEGLVRIPMSIPQDEDMVDRLHLGPEEMSRVWLRVLHESRRFGEVFVICLHPERAAICAAPLDATLTEARSRGDIWIAPLGDIAAWWKERAHAAVSVERDGHDGQWRVRADGSGRTVVAFGQRKIQGSAVVEIEAAHKPVVYAGPEWPDASCRRIAEAGYVITRDQADAGACSIDLTRDFSTAGDSEEVVRRLHGRSDELIRLQPWPAGFRSCLSVTGDIDALTLFDFAMRFKEFS